MQSTSALNEANPLVPRQYIGVVLLFLTGAGYWAAARLGLLFIPVGGGVTPIWPPNALALGICLVVAARRWPWVFAGVFAACMVANLAAARSLPQSVAFTGANVVEIAVAAALFRIFHRGHTKLATRREAGILAVIAGPLFAMTAIVGGLVGKLMLGGSLMDEWMRWWFGTAVGVLLVVPAIVLVASALRDRVRVRAKRVLEAATWLAMHGAVCVLVFYIAPSVDGKSALSAAVYPYLTLLTLLFVTVRFGLVGSTLASLITAGCALSGSFLAAYAGLGSPLNEQHIMSLQLFLAVSSLLGLYVAAQRQEQVEGENALRESEERFRLLATHAPNGIFLTDRDGLVNYVNGAACEIAARPAEMLLGAQGLNAIHADDRGGMLGAWRAAIASDGDFSHSYRFVRPDGAIRWIVGMASPMHDRGHDITGYVGMLTDITPIKEAEQRLRESEQRFRQMADAMPAMVWLSDSCGNRHYFNRAWLEFRGRTLGEEAGMGWVEGLHANDSVLFMSTYSEAVRTRSPFSIEYQIRRHDGDYRWVLSTGAPRYTDDGTYLGMIGSCMDVTTLREAETTRLAMQAQLQESARLESIARLSAGVAHEFNNLLTSVLGNANLAQLEPGLSSAARDHISRIEESALQASELTRKMLAYAGRAPSIRSLHCLSALVEETLPLLRASLPRPLPLGVRLEANVPEIVADAAQVQQLLVNLFTNAVESVDDGEGGVEISTRALHVSNDVLGELGAGDEMIAGEYVVLTVSDQGCGISAKDLPQIFDPFFSTKFLGRGLGLASVQGIVRSHGGWIRAQSALGRGSTFTVYLPAAARPSVTLSVSVRLPEFSI